MSSPSSSFRQPVRALAAWLVFPALLAAITTAATLLLARGTALPLVSGGVTLGALGLILLLERLRPLHRSWNAAPERLDLVLLVGNRLVDIAVVAIIFAGLGLLERLGWRGQLLRIWPTSAPLPVQAALGIVLAEALRYLFHRLSHGPGLLGRVHTTHHQPARMYTLNGPRLHPGNYLWIAVANSLPMLLLGAALEAVVLAAAITSFFVLFQHANLRLPFWGWNRVFATPDAHRLHHLRERTGEHAVNYGIVLFAFDQLFGTYEAPAADPAADAIGSAAPPASLVPAPDAVAAGDRPGFSPAKFRVNRRG